MGPPPPLDLAAVAVRTDEGLMLVGLWDSEEAANAAWNSPDLERTAKEVGMPAAGDVTFTLHPVHRYHLES